jgi:hypothetical protein
MVRFSNEIIILHKVNNFFLILILFVKAKQLFT